MEETGAGWDDCGSLRSIGWDLRIGGGRVAGWSD